MAKIVQQKIFDTSHKIFVMSEGMKDLYKEKYNVETIPLLHSFSEEVDEKEFNNNNIEKSIFWGGAIYAINKETVKRIHLACTDLDYTLTLSAANTYEKLTNLGFENNNIKSNILSIGANFEELYFNKKPIYDIFVDCNLFNRRNIVDIVLRLKKETNYKIKICGKNWKN